MLQTESKRVYRFLDEQALERERTKCFMALVNAVTQRAVDDYLENNEYAYSAWKFLKRSFPKLKDLKKPDLEKTRKQTYLYENEEITIF
jgi:hypothetical protein